MASPPEKTGIQLIVRADDMGMTHATNLAIQKAFEEGILTCAAIQAVAPWAEEAASWARDNPERCIGVHLAALGEWKGYPWRPVLPYDRLGSLVDARGFFWRTPEQYFKARPKAEDLEAEFRAQVELILGWGVKVGYLDTHYLGYDEGEPDMPSVVQKIADDYGVPYSMHVGEGRCESIYNVEPAEKPATLARVLGGLGPGLHLSVHHVLMDAPDSQVLVHSEPKDVMNPSVAAHRTAELKALLDPAVKRTVESKGIQLVDYRNFKKAS